MQADHYTTRPGPWISEPMRRPETLTKPAFEVPAEACDSHMHVFGPAGRPPGVAKAKYTLPEGDLADYLGVAKVLGLGRMVLVQASYYGTDNSCILDAAEEMGSRARLVVFLPDQPERGLIDDLSARGVRGLRLDLFKMQAAGLSNEDVLQAIRRAAEVARAAGWHLELYSPGPYVSALIERLPDLKVDFSVNHMGYMVFKDGLSERDFNRFLDVATSERCWVKLSGPYRINKGGGHEVTDWMGQELVRVAPDRLVWGTDWPHIPEGSRDTGQELNQLARWCPDPSVRNKILVDNPARLYGF